MLKKQFRLTKRKDFDRLFQAGSYKYYGNKLAVRLIANGLSYNRFGFMISRRLCRLAVGRNLIRRRLAALIRQDYPKLQSGYDVVVLLLIKQPAIKLTDLQEELTEAWKRLRIIV